MENQLEDHLSMFQKVQGTLSRHASETALIPVVSAYKSEFDRKVDTILLLASKADTDITGITVDKQVKRMALKEKILKISTALVAFGAVNNDYSLLEKCDETVSSMDAMRDNDFYTYSHLILNEAMSKLELLNYYGVEQNDLIQAQAAAQNYLNAIQNPRIEINERSMALEELRETVKETSLFLKEKLDKVMGVFQSINVGLYFTYMGARSIDQSGSFNAPDYSGLSIPNGFTKVAEIPYLTSRSFNFKNTGTVSLQFTLTKTADILEGNTITVIPGSAVTRSTGNLNPDGMATKIYVKNEDREISGEYKIWIYE